MLLRKIKTVLRVDGEYDTLIAELVDLACDSIKAYCNITSVPKNLEFIVVEMVVARYNRLGTEGLRSEQVDVVKQEFYSNMLDLYRVYLDQYKERNSSIRFI